MRMPQSPREDPAGGKASARKPGEGLVDAVAVVAAAVGALEEALEGEALGDDAVGGGDVEDGGSR